MEIRRCSGLGSCSRARPSPSGRSSNDRRRTRSTADAIAEDDSSPPMDGEARVAMYAEETNERKRTVNSPSLGTSVIKKLTVGIFGSSIITRRDTSWEPWRPARPPSSRPRRIGCIRVAPPRPPDGPCPRGSAWVSDPMLSRDALPTNRPVGCELQPTWRTVSAAAAAWFAAAQRFI